MAARQITRRLQSLFPTGRPQTPLSKESLRQSLSPANSIFSINNSCKRRIQTVTKPGEEAVNDVERHEASNSGPNYDSAKAVSNPTINNNSATEFNATTKMKVSSRHDLAMMFTCKVCETRSIKTMCRESYEKGVVLARCGGCNNVHLIADHLGWFGERGSIEDILAARGEEVKRGSADTLNLTLEDLAGKDLGKTDG